MELHLSTLALRLRHARNKKGISMEELARRAGIKRGVIQAAELGGTAIPRPIVAIAKALDVSPSWLAFGEGAFDAVSKEAVDIAIAWDKLPSDVKAALSIAILKKQTP